MTFMPCIADKNCRFVNTYCGEARESSASSTKLTDPQMMRYRGKFQRAAYRHIVIDESDEGEILEEKWKTWYEQESWKR